MMPELLWNIFAWIGIWFVAVTVPLGIYLALIVGRGLRSGKGGARVG